MDNFGLAIYQAKTTLQNCYYPSSYTLTNIGFHPTLAFVAKYFDLIIEFYIQFWQGVARGNAFHLCWWPYEYIRCTDRNYDQNVSFATLPQDWIVNSMAKKDTLGSCNEDQMSTTRLSQLGPSSMLKIPTQLPVATIDHAFSTIQGCLLLSLNLGNETRLRTNSTQLYIDLISLKTTGKIASR